MTKTTERIHKWLNYLHRRGLETTGEVEIALALIALAMFPFTLILFALYFTVPTFAALVLLGLIVLSIFGFWLEIRNWRFKRQLRKQGLTSDIE